MMKRQAILEATEEEEGDVGEDEKKLKSKKGDNLDLLRETGVPPGTITGGPADYGYGNGNDFY